MEEKEVEIKFSLYSIFLVILIFYFSYNFIKSWEVVFKNPISFGDEGFHTSLARYISENKEIPKYIPFEGTNLIRDGFYRPPLWNLLLASFFLFFDSYEFTARIVTLIINFFLGIAAFVLVKRISDEVHAFFSSVLLIAFQSVITYTVFFYYSILLLFFTTLSLLSFLVFIKEENKKLLFLSSIFASLAVLTNQFALTLYAAFLIYIFFEFWESKKMKEIFKKYSFFILLLILIPSGYIFRNILAYRTPVCFSMPFVGKFFDTSSCKIDNFDEKYNFVGQAIPIGTESSAFSIDFMNYLEFAYFNPIFTILPLMIGILLAYYSNEKYQKFLLIYFLIFILLILEVGKTRAEDTARYTLGFASLIAILSSLTYKEIYNFLESKVKYISFLLIVLILFVSLRVVNSRLVTLDQVKTWDPSFFNACQWIRFNTEKNASIATIWGHNGAWCSERNMAPMLADIMLSNDLNYTLKVLKENQINYLWIQKGSIDPLNRGYADNYPINFIELLINNPKYFIKVYENGDPIEYCTQACNGQTIYKLNLTNF